MTLKALMCGKKNLVISIVLLSSFLSTPVAFAIGDDKNSRLSLKGLKKLSVVVQIEKPALEEFRKVGVTEERIRTAIGLKLREAQIDVVLSDAPATGTPILHVELNGSNRNGKTFSFLIEIELWQMSILKRDPNAEMITGTWSTGAFGSGPASNLGSDLIGLINNMMDTFVRAYQSVNS